MAERNSYAKDAEGAGRMVVEIIGQRRLKLWRLVFTDADDEARYVAWLATWACHWAGKALLCA